MSFESRPEQKEREPNLSELVQGWATVISGGLAAIQYAQKNEGKLKANMHTAFQKMLQHPDKVKEIAVGSGMGMVNDFMAVRRAHIEEKSAINRRVVDVFRQFTEHSTGYQAAKQTEQETAQESRNAMRDLDEKIGEFADYLFPWLKR
jgi:hypothetical protein